MKSFWKRIFSGVKQKSVAFLRASSISLNGSEDFHDGLNLRTFRDSLYLFIGVSLIRETVSSIPLEMYRIKNAQGDTEQVFEDDFLEILERPNYIQTQKEFWKLSIAYYLLAGEAFWYLEKEKSAVPTAMVNMRPDHVEILLSQDKKTIIGYEFMQANGTAIKLLPEEVLHIKNIDPLNPTRGVGVVRPATQRIITEREASKHQADTFRNQGRPDIAVFTSVDLSTEDAETARENWQKIYGKDNGSQAGFFGDDVKSIQMLNVSPKEMDFINSQNFLRDDILAALHVPKAMVTSDDVNLANSRTARINYIKEACLPVLDTFIDIINNKLLNDQGNDTFITYENPVIEDRDMILKEAVELKNAGIISPNEARALMNYDSVDGGDELAQGSSGMFQLSMKKKTVRKIARRQLTKRPILMKKFEAYKAVTNMLEMRKEVNRQRNSVFNTPELKESYIKAFNNKIDSKARIFKDTVDVYYQGFEKRTMEHLEKFGMNPTNIFDVSTEMRTSRDIFVPLMQNMFKKVGQETLDDVANGFSSKASESFFTPEQMLQMLEQRAEFFSSSMLDTDFNRLKKIIADGLEAGKGVAEIGRDIRSYFDDISVSRAKTIARTETGHIVSQATNEAYKQSSLVTGKEWLTANDSKVRDEHMINNGVIVGTNDSFPNGEHYPGESTINCRCALAPAV
jgi:HK97 family phage portal protein